MGAQKPGDKYNYEIAAYLKVAKIERPPFSDLDFRKFSFNPNPPSVFSQTFRQLISVDLIGSDSSTECIFECKHSEEPRPIGINAPEFRSALLEFLGLEECSASMFRELTFFVVTNMPKGQLEEDIGNLRTTPNSLVPYLGKLYEQAGRKWGNFDATISQEILLRVLSKLIIIRIDDGQLATVSRTTEFREALLDIVRDVDRRDPSLVPISLLSLLAERQVRLIAEDDNDVLEEDEAGTTVKISSTIIKQIADFQSSLKDSLVKATTESLPFLKSCEVSSSLPMSPDQIGLFLTRATNDVLANSQSRYICIFFPSQYEMFFVEKTWAREKVESLRDKWSGHFKLLGEENGVGEIPPYVSIFLIKETKRLMEGIIVDSRLIDEK